MKILATVRLTDQHLEALRRVSPEARLVRELDPERAKQEMRDADVLCCFGLPGPLQEAKALKWIQLVSAGADHLFDAGIEKTDILVTTASGIHRYAMAEYILCAMIMLARRIPLVLRESQQHQWKPSRLRTYYGEELYGKTLGVVGTGAIGRHAAASASCLGMRIIGVRRSGHQGGDDLVEEYYGPDELVQMLPRCDFVLISVPYTGQTRGLIGEPELKAMKPSAYLVNIARGGIVDEKALARALREGWIAGAAVDVFEEEPLPPDSELWQTPNLVITPHMAGGTLPYMDRAAEIFRENLRRYLAGEPMVNVLDKEKGY